MTRRPGTRSRSPADRRRPPEPLGPLVGGVLAELGIGEKVERARAAAEWEEVVGPHIARVTGRARVRGRTLLVEVKSAAWIAELGMMRRRLLERLNAGKTRGRIEKIVFIQAGGSTPAARGRAGRRGRRTGEVPRPRRVDDESGEAVNGEG